MALIERSAILMQPAERMFDLINDVEAYPEFMRGCEQAVVIEQSDCIMVARLSVKKAGLRQSFTTRNELSRPERIIMELVEGPFSKFAGQWHITALSEQASKVELRLDFTVSSGLASKALEQLFKSVADDLVGAMSARAESANR